MSSGFRGTFVISWSQTELDGLEAPPVDAIGVGATWSWRGKAVLVDGAAGALRLEGPAGSGDLRKRAAQMVRRIVGIALGDGDAKSHSVEPRPADSSFILTNGAQTFTVTVIDIGCGRAPLLMFLDEVPPQNSELWVVHHTVSLSRISAEEPDSKGVICFTEGTRIATMSGSIAVETLKLGDLVLTKDNGPQPIEWIGKRHMSGARLFAMPRLRPVRLRAGALGIEQPDLELLVSPEHRMLVTGRVALDLFNTPEVLVAAKDLIDHRLVVTDTIAPSVTYIHLLLPKHNVVWANGVATESFHPADSALSSLSAEDRSTLLARHPDLAADPYTYGGLVRRSLTSAEAAILRQAA